MTNRSIIHVINKSIYDQSFNSHILICFIVVLFCRLIYTRYIYICYNLTWNMSAVTVSEHTSPSSGSLSRKNSNFAIRNIFRSSKRHRSKESIDTVSTKSCEKEQVKSSSEPKQDTMMCNVCFSWKNTSLFPVLLSCEHRNCIDCLKQYLVIAVKECRVMVSCPECSEVFHPSDVKMIFNDDNLFAKYEEFTLRRALVGIPDIRWCPAPDCGYAVIASGCASCPQLKCMRPGCSYEFCYHCRQLWHPNTTCDLARMQNQFEIRSLSSADRKSSNMHEDIKPCPKCMALIIKMDDGSCNHMTCAVCGGEFCWLCMKEISDLHYLRYFFRCFLFVQVKHHLQVLCQSTMK